MIELHHVRRGSGPTLVLLHGIGGELCVWDPVVEALAEEFDVIALDLPGFGASPILPDDAVPTPSALASAVAGFVSSLGVASFDVAGNSLGGWVALELGRLGVVSSVVGVCPAGLWGAGVAARNLERGPRRSAAVVWSRRLRFLIPLVFRSRRVRRLVLQYFVAHPDRVPRRDAVRMAVSYGRSTAYDGTNYAMRSSRLERAEEIRVPVTLGWGSEDRLLKPRELAAPDVEAVTLPDCGHVPMWDAPSLVVDLIRRGVQRSASSALSSGS